MLELVYKHISCKNFGIPVTWGGELPPHTPPPRFPHQCLVNQTLLRSRDHIPRYATAPVWAK